MSQRNVAVAMSGGVDSSVAAALLLEQGCRVIGLTMRLWFDPEAEEDPAARSCCSLEAVDDARGVAGRLGIPYYVINLKEQFKSEVVDYFTAEYIRGRTPNPCVICNRRIKFGLLLQKAMDIGCEYLATGHYVRSQRDPRTGRTLLKKGLDKDKDQSYMLYNLTQEQLKRTLFPLGGLKKDEVRAKARHLNLPVAEKQESQDVCFIPGGDYRSFLREQAGEFPPGPIVDTSGRRLGEHGGLPYYTIGQRRHLGISAAEPLYVVEIRTVDNTLVVGRREEAYVKSLLVSDLNLISVEKLEDMMKVEARIRYRAGESPAVLHPPDQRGTAYLEFAVSQSAVTPGQAAVFYNGENVIGGGTILKTGK